MSVQKEEIMRIRSSQTNLYLLKAGEGLLLVDAGARGSFQRLQKGLDRHGFSPADIRLIVLTHAHYDHVGGLKEIAEQTGANVLAHEAEADYMASGFTPFPRGTGPFSRVLAWFGRTVLAKMGGYAPIAPDIVIDKPFDLGAYGIQGRVEPTPGHTAGSLSIVLGSGSALIGDTLFHFPPWRVYPPFADDQPALVRSWQKLLDTGCRTFYPGHGSPVLRDLLVRKAAGLTWQG